MRRDRVLVLYNEPVLPATHPDYESEIEVLLNVEAVSAVLADAGYEVSRLGVRDAQSLLTGLSQADPDVVVNLHEGDAANNASELYVAGVLEWLGVSYTGCPFPTLSLARSKHMAKRLFAAEGLPTSPFLVVDQLSDVADCRLNFPLICKPAQQDASVGVSQRSVATDVAALRRNVEWLLDQFGPPVLVEEFIAGREVAVALVEMPELRLLPITEIVFPEARPDYWPILTYEAKWLRSSDEYDATDFNFGVDLGAELSDKVATAARRVFRLLGARDYARVDFRVRQSDNQPFILELNPNPCFVPGMALTNNLKMANITHAEFTLQLVRNALARRGTNAPRRWARQAS